MSRCRLTTPLIGVMMMSPKVESDGLVLDLIETDVDRGYAHIVCFSFFETGDDGAVSETEYYDDYCMKRDRLTPPGRVNTNHKQS